MTTYRITWKEDSIEYVALMTFEKIETGMEIDRRMRDKREMLSKVRNLMEKFPLEIVRVEEVETIEEVETTQSESSE